MEERKKPISKEKKIKTNTENKETKSIKQINKEPKKET